MIRVLLLGCWAFFMARGWRQGYWRFLAIVYAIDATLLTFSINFQTYAQPCNSGNGEGIPTPGKKLCRAVADMQRWEVEKCALGTSNNVTICKNDTFSRGFQYSIFEKHLDPRFHPKAHSKQKSQPDVRYFFKIPREQYVKTLCFPTAES